MAEYSVRDDQLHMYYAHPVRYVTTWELRGCIGHDCRNGCIMGATFSACMGAHTIRGSNCKPCRFARSCSSRKRGYDEMLAKAKTTPCQFVNRPHRQIAPTMPNDAVAKDCIALPYADATHIPVPLISCHINLAAHCDINHLGVATDTFAVPHTATRWHMLLKGSLRYVVAAKSIWGLRRRPLTPLSALPVFNQC